MQVIGRLALMSWIAAVPVGAFGPSNLQTFQTKRSHQWHSTNNKEDGTQSSAQSDDQQEDSTVMPIIDTSTIKIDDGGSDLTDRFKYQVNALMGKFDPADASKDNEYQNGNILNAMLQFPVSYTFNVVGKTLGMHNEQESFVSRVKAIVMKETGELEDRVSMQIIPRGETFTKVSVTVEVQSAEMIAAIYNGLKQMEASVMQF